jgi:hypothetical protein
MDAAHALVFTHDEHHAKSGLTAGWDAWARHE